LKHLDKEECLSTLIGLKENIPFFSKLSENEIRELVTDIKFLKYKKGEIIIEQGTKDNEIYIILSGSCNVSFRHESSHDLKEKLRFVHLAELSRKDIFGELSAVTDTPRTARVSSKMDGTTLLSIQLDMENEKINDILVKVYKSFLQEVSKKIHEANRKIHSQTLKNFI